MKKLLIVLMVVAMASFLFVGCLGDGVTPDIDDVDEDEVPAPTSTPPTILDIQKSDGVTSIVDLTSTKTQYINKTEAGTSILVTGIASSKALVQVYIGSAATPVAVGEATATGLFSVAVAKTALGADSLVAKTLHATSTELGLAESLASNVATFILDTDLPGIKEVKFTASEGVEDGEAEVTVGEDTVIAAIDEVEDIISDEIEDGTWTIDVLGVEPTPPVGVSALVKITGPDYESTLWVSSTSPIFTEGNPIPGVEFELLSFERGARGEIECTAEVDAIPGRATLKFDEVVSYAAATATTCFYGGEVDDTPYAYKEAIDTGYWTGLDDITVGTPYTITVYGVKDLAGNVGGTEDVPLTKSAIASAASETLLEP